jgi:hypothetical protein
MFRANLAYLRVPRRRAVVKAEIEERSFVANYAPLDDGQVRFGGGTGRLGEADGLNLTRTGGEECDPESFSLLNFRIIPRTILEFFAWVDGLEAVGLVLGGDFSVTQAYRGETFGETHARAVPPIAADGAAGLEDAIFVVNGFVHVQMALQNGDDLMIFEEGDDVGRIFDAVGIVFLAAFGLGRIAEEAGDERDVADDDDRRGGCD